MRLAIRRTAFLAIACWLTRFGTPAHVGSLTPNRAAATATPAGYLNISAGNPKFAVSTGPNPAVFIPNGMCRWLLPALAAEGFAKADPTNPRGYSGAMRISARTGRPGNPGRLRGAGNPAVVAAR